MTGESTDNVAPDDWARMIRLVADHQDRAAFARLFDHFAPRVKSWMRRAGASEHVAEDLAQETLLMVWRKAQLYNPEAAGASAWIFAIARNLRIDAFRRDSRTGGAGSGDIDFEFEIDDQPLADARLMTAETETRIRAALKDLSADQLRVVELSFFEDRAHADIAQTLGIPLGTVKSRLRLAMQKLRGLLGELS